MLIVNGASAIHHTATTDEPWDGPAAVADMPNDATVLKYCHAWRDYDGDPDAKGTYKFPHHKTEGGPANLAACRNGLSRLSQANIPEDDKAGVRSHLQAHINDAQGEEDRLKGRLRNRMGAAKRWYRIENAMPDEEPEGPAMVYVYDEISYWGVTAQNFVKDLMGIDKDRIVLHMNTPGGDVFDGIAIYNALRQHKAEVTVYVDSLAASIGSIIAMAGDTIKMAKYSTMMIHDASGAVIGGNAADMREMAELLDKTSANLAQVYADRTGTSVEDWRDLMRAETWFSAEEAVEFGLADEVDQGNNTRVDNKWDLSLFNYKSRDDAPPPLQVAATRPATPPAPRDNVLVPVRSTAENSVATPGGVADAGTPFEFDPDAFATAMRYAADPPVETVEAPFHFDPQIFRAMMEDRSASAPALAQTPQTEDAPSFENTFDPEFLRARIREGTRSA